MGQPGIEIAAAGQFQDLKQFFHVFQIEIGEGSVTFEFFITSVATPNYKYRVMFVEYGIAFFPVYLTLDESIALELGAEESMECANQEEFEKILEKILNSEKIEKVINNLLTIGKTVGKGKFR